jgi:hypothetical protein
MFTRVTRERLKQVLEGHFSDPDEIPLNQITHLINKNSKKSFVTGLILGATAIGLLILYFA